MFWIEYCGYRNGLAITGIMHGILIAIVLIIRIF